MVRSRLNAGILTNLYNVLAAKLKAIYEGYDRDGYAFLLLGACAMTIGCKLTDRNLALMRKHFKNVGLMSGAVEQMANALGETGGYENNGQPHDFGELYTINADGRFVRDENDDSLDPPGSRLPFDMGMAELMGKGEMAKVNAQLSENTMGHFGCRVCGRK